ncbi:hypothetical protein BCR44DRAFT_206759 [Catenaria anguillulae PL171]|uniref:Uncharacterized protein n=1 Tax=Catenaria anguillulae PL171 TaxID=765915 RepID=A0A1Y2H889_9FUNG|nr:hypothetical protein BCR44DRAFT_206759 [Catenaria anguillulae PL171]
MESNHKAQERKISEMEVQLEELKYRLRAAENRAALSTSGSGLPSASSLLSSGSTTTDNVSGTLFTELSQPTSNTIAASPLPFRRLSGAQQRQLNAKLAAATSAVTLRHLASPSTRPSWPASAGAHIPAVAPAAAPSVASPPPMAKPAVQALSSAVPTLTMEQLDSVRPRRRRWLGSKTSGSGSLSTAGPVPIPPTPTPVSLAPDAAAAAAPPLGFPGSFEPDQPWTENTTSQQLPLPVSASAAAVKKNRGARRGKTQDDAQCTQQ